MRKSLFITLLFAFAISSSALLAQEISYQHQTFKTPKGASLIARKIRTDYQPLMQNLEAPAPGSGSYHAYLNQAKAEMMKDFVPRPNVAKKTGTASQPNLFRNFEGNNYFSGVPNDNDLSISNDGKIISCINSNIFMLDDTGAVLADMTLAAFSDTLNLPATKYDPRTMYDPIADRFIIVCLSGFDDQNTDIVVGFSQTNDPTGAWNLYSLPGNPRNNGTWTDFPMIGLTEDEFFLTGNAIFTGQPWETGFNETYIWQIDKQTGYDGDSLESLLWFDVLYGGKSIRNLRPVKGGSQLYGPNMYFISNRNFDVSNDSVFIVEITDTAGAPGIALNVDVRLTDLPYGFPPNGKQKFNQFFATNDGRFLSAFYENDEIQFAGNTTNPANGLAGIYHGTISNVATSKDVTGVIFGDSLLDYGYPNLSYVGMNPGDHDCVIHFNYTAVDSFDGMAAIYYDGLSDYSNPVVIKSGVNFVNILTGAIERWGDYSGSQPKYNEPGVIWVNGSWGRSNRTFGTWIGELTSPAIVGREPSPQGKSLEVSNYPNPTADLVFLEFEIPGAKMLDIALYNQQGQEVKLLLRDRVKGGLNRFSFSTRDLPQGIYYLRVADGNALLASKKVVVSR